MNFPRDLVKLIQEKYKHFRVNKMLRENECCRCKNLYTKVCIQFIKTEGTKKVKKRAVVCKKCYNRYLRTQTAKAANLPSLGKSRYKFPKKK